LNPSHAGTLFNAALISLDLGDIQAARNLEVRLQRLDPYRAGEIARRISDALTSGR
jgi:hypothetical protein